MKKISNYYLYFISAALFAFSSIMFFISSKVPLGICYTGLTVAFISLGLSDKNKGK